MKQSVEKDIRRRVEEELKKTVNAPVKNVYRQIEKQEELSSRVDRKQDEVKQYGQRKDERRQKQLDRVEKDLEEIKRHQSNPKEFDKDVQDAMKNPVLRLTEARIETEMKTDQVRQ